MKDFEKLTSDEWAHLVDQLVDYGSRVFAGIVLIDPRTERVAKGGKSILDFVSDVIVDLLSEKVVWHPERGSLLKFLKIALRADIIDHLRSQASRVENIEDFVEPEAWQQKKISDHESEILAARIGEMVKDDAELAKLVQLIMEMDVAKPRDLAVIMGVPVQQIYNLRRRLVRKILKLPFA